MNLVMDATAVCVVKVLFVFQKLVIDFPQFFVEAVFGGGSVVILIVVLATIGVLPVFHVPEFVIHLAVAQVGSLTQFYAVCSFLQSRIICFYSTNKEGLRQLLFWGVPGPCHQCPGLFAVPEAT